MGTVFHPNTTLRGPIVIGDKCEIGPDTYIGPYTSIGNGCTIKNTELENSIVMENAKIDTGNRITDSIIGRGVEIRQSKHNLPRSNKMILGDMSKLTL